MAQLGKSRSAAKVILLSIVTLGIYWFVWISRNFQEVARHRDRDLKPKKWIWILVSVWILGLAFLAADAVAKDIDRIRDPNPYQPPGLRDALFPAYTPFRIAAVTLAAAYYALQLAYLRRAETIVREAITGIQGANAPHPSFLVLFNAFFAIGGIPILGTILNMAATVLAILWIVRVQDSVNRYWQFWAVTTPMPFTPAPSAEPVSSTRSVR